MMVGSWFVPDEVDLATGGLTLLGKPLRATYKIAKTFKAVVTVGARINRVRDKLSAMVPAVRKSLGHSNFSIVMKRKKFREARGGHVGPNGQRLEAAMGEVKEEEEILCHIPGGTCFVRGTLISSERGLRAIETIREKELVWSRDETTGKTELKRVVRTFEKHSATLKLTFSNGETIETTKEHPFYVENAGFRAAGEMGIGTSIVTRAGPSVTLASTSRGEAQTVYNFEVEDFHTYFVGKSEAWVHNQCSNPVATSIANGHAFEKHVLQKGEFSGLGIRTKDQFAAHIDNVMKSPVNKPLSNGRHAYWDDATSTVVITNPNAPDGGTCFQPDLTRYPGRAYYDQLT